MSQIRPYHVSMGQGQAVIVLEALLDATNTLHATRSAVLSARLALRSTHGTLATATVSIDAARSALEDASCVLRAAFAIAGFTSAHLPISVDSISTATAGYTTDSALTAQTHIHPGLRPREVFANVGEVGLESFSGLLIVLESTLAPCSTLTYYLLGDDTLRDCHSILFDTNFANSDVTRDLNLPRRLAQVLPAPTGQFSNTCVVHGIDNLLKFHFGSSSPPIVAKSRKAPGSTFIIYVLSTSVMAAAIAQASEEAGNTVNSISGDDSDSDDMPELLEELYIN
ncbi:hypothetical protein DFH11DRAFT_1725329 [Phellopilus nigrolimitatus]|nr:hypothetical protein DFH11DRAFT_1738508 [Phellopilus nigrolimitatus]KAH8116570.1 hypothetical protein DFH11DRAFT_1725329 [Phellopilus nigrolimitatus]